MAIFNYIYNIIGCRSPTDSSWFWTQKHDSESFQNSLSKTDPDGQHSRNKLSSTLAASSRNLTSEGASAALGLGVALLLVQSVYFGGCILLLAPMWAYSLTHPHSQLCFNKHYPLVPVLTEHLKIWKKQKLKHCLKMFRAPISSFQCSFQKECDAVRSPAVTAQCNSQAPPVSGLFRPFCTFQRTRFTLKEQHYPVWATRDTCSSQDMSRLITYICMHACMYMCVCICMCTHIHTHTKRETPTGKTPYPPLGWVHSNHVSVITMSGRKHETEKKSLDFTKTLVKDIGPQFTLTYSCLPVLVKQNNPQDSGSTGRTQEDVIGLKGCWMRREAKPAYW